MVWHLGVALAADIAGRSAGLPASAAWLIVSCRSSSPRLLRNAPLPLRGRPRLRRLSASLSFAASERRLLPRLDRSSHQVREHVLRSRWPSIVTRNQRLMQTGSPDGSRQTAEKARENVGLESEAGRDTAPVAGHSRAKPAVNLKTLDQAARRRNVEHRLGYEGARQRSRAVLLPDALPGRGQ